MSKRVWDLLAKAGLAEVAEPTPEAPVAAVATAPVPAVAPTPTAPQPTDPEAIAKLKALDEGFRTRLIDAMANDGAPLVEELADTLETLKDHIPDEQARFKAALKLMAKKGFGLQALLGDYDKCLGVLEQHDRTFEVDLQTQLDQRVGSKVRAVKDLDGQIQAKQTQVETLQREIAELTEKRNTEQAGISVEQSKVNQFKERFGFVSKGIRKEVETQRAKVVQYGQGL